MLAEELFLLANEFDTHRGHLVENRLNLGRKLGLVAIALIRDGNLRITGNRSTINFIMAVAINVLAAANEAENHDGGGRQHYFFHVFLILWVKIFF